MDGESQPRATIGYGRIATIVVIVLAVAGTAWLVTSLTRVLLLIFAAVVFAVIFDAIARRLVRWTGMPRGLAITVAVFALIAAFAGVFFAFGAQLVQQFDEIRSQFPRALTSVQQLLDSYGLGEPARNMIRQGGSDAASIASRAGGYLLSATSGLSDLVLVLVGAIFLASDPAVYRRGLLLLFPRSAEPTAEAVLDDMKTAIRGWMRGQAVSMIVVSILTSGGLWLLGVPAFGGLGLIAGLLDPIPFIGPIIAGVPAVLLAFTVSPLTALWTVLLFVVIQQIQGNFLQPMIQKQAVDVPPAVLLFAVIAAGVLFGFLGIMLAAPLTVVVFVLVQRVYVKTLLGKDIKVAGRDAAAGDD